MYRTYVTDALQCIAENGTHYVGMDGMSDYGRYMTHRWVDLVNGTASNEPEEEDNRTVDEIVDDIWAKIEGKEDE